MTIEELNKLIKEELDAFLEAEGDDDTEGGDDIEVTTDEPAVETGEEAMDLLRQIYDMIKPQVEPEGGEEIDAADVDLEEPADDAGDDEAADEEPEEDLDEAIDNHTFFRGDNVGRTVVKAKDVQGTREKASLKEGFDGTSRFQKLANIKK